MTLKIGDIVIGYGATLYEIIDIQNSQYTIKIIKILKIDGIYQNCIGKISRVPIEEAVLRKITPLEKMKYL